MKCPEIYHWQEFTLPLPHSTLDYEHDNMEGSDLTYVLRNDFTTLPLEQRLKIKADGKPRPIMNLKSPRGGGGKSGNGKQAFRRFNQGLFDKFEWLTGSGEQQKLYCWPCVLFSLTTSSLNNPWVVGGYDDMNNFHGAAKHHGERCKKHTANVIRLKLFGRVRINEQVDESVALGVQRHNAEVAQNRALLKRFIIATLYLARQEQAFRGHDESETSSNRGNYVQLVHSFAKIDESLAAHLKSSTVFSGMSSSIQNDLIDSIARVIQDEVDKELSTTPFLAVEADDTSDISRKCQLTVIVRYVNDKGVICERFLGFFDVSQDRDAEAITAVVMKAIGSYNPASKLICQTYDGASCMSGKRGGVQALVKAVCPLSLCPLHPLLCPQA